MNIDTTFEGKSPSSMLRLLQSAHSMHLHLNILLYPDISAWYSDR